MQYLSDHYPSLNTYLNDDLLVSASRKGSIEFEAVETLLKGKEVELPRGQTFPDKNGNLRSNIRIRWWNANARTYRDAYLGPEKALNQVPNDRIDADHLTDYSTAEPPVFIGHYWLDTEPDVLAQNVVCLDYSVDTRNGGKLVSYRWDGEQQLSKEKFVYVTREPC